MDLRNAIEAYFNSWTEKDRSRFRAIFAADIVYSECYGPEYHGLVQIEKWFDDWNKNGSVLVWKVKNIYRDGDVYAAEWYFECDCAGKTDGFDGVSLIRFNEEGKIAEVKEFKSVAEHYLPYEQ